MHRNSKKNTAPRSPHSFSAFKVPIFSALLLVIGCRALRDSGTAPGQYAPDLSLTTTSGESKTLHFSDLKQTTVVNFFASWCPPCLAELPDLERLSQIGKEKGIGVIAIGIDDEPALLAEAARNAGVTFPIYVDSTREAKGLFKINGLPETFVVDPEGKIAFLNDPESSEPQVKVVGPREWDSKEMLSALLKIKGGQK